MSDIETPVEPEAEESLDTRLVRELATVLNDTGLTEIEVERGELRIRVAKTVAAPQALVAAPAAAPQSPAAEVEAAPGPGSAKPTGVAVKSPMVGTVYLQPQPGAPPFVRVGERVTEGQTLLLVEAMKTMNPIPAPRGGTVKEICVENGAPVEFGQTLLILV